MEELASVKTLRWDGASLVSRTSMEICMAREREQGTDSVLSPFQVGNCG